MHHRVVLVTSRGFEEDGEKKQREKEKEKKSDRGRENKKKLEG